MEISMMDNGSKVSKMVEVSILMLLLKLYIVDNGNKVKKMDKDIWNYQIKNIIMVHLSNLLNKALVLRYLSMAINIKDNIKMGNSMEKASISGLMNHVIKVNSSKEFVLAKAAGNLLKTTQISISVHI